LTENHIFCLPSHAEGLSVALLESMAMSCAVVATPVGEHGSILRHGVNALVTQPGDVEGLRQALERVIRDSALRADLASNARQSVLNGFTSDHTLREVSAALLKASRT
jgi:glycosyltransferase involved in cell wall biosynthesis